MSAEANRRSSYIDTKWKSSLDKYVSHSLNAMSSRVKLVRGRGALVLARSRRLEQGDDILAYYSLPSTIVM